MKRGTPPRYEGDTTMDTLTVEKISKAMKCDAFWLDASSEAHRIVLEATRRGFIKRLSHTQVQWTEAGLEKARAELEPATTSCTHPMAFFALSLDGCRTREATRDEVYAWVVGQKHPKFSLAAPLFLCFDSNVRAGEVIISRERTCYCPTNQPYMD